MSENTQTSERSLKALWKETTHLLPKGYVLIPLAIERVSLEINSPGFIFNSSNESRDNPEIALQEMQEFLKTWNPDEHPQPENRDIS